MIYNVLRKNNTKVIHAADAMSALILPARFLSLIVLIFFLVSVVMCLDFSIFTERYNTKNRRMMFQFRPYLKAELALLYNPHCTQDSAMKTLYRWIRGCPLLVEELKSMNYNPHRHSYLKREVEAIVRHLGEP